MLERGPGLFDNLLEELTVRVAARLRHQHKFARSLPVRAELLDSYRLPVRIARAREDVFVLFSGKVFDDFRLGERWRRFRLGYICDTVNVMLRRRRERSLRSVLRVQQSAMHCSQSEKDNAAQKE